MSGSRDQASRADGVIRLKITPVSDFYDENDPRYTSEAFELQRALNRELPGELEVRSAPGEKGVITDLIIHISTDAAMTGLIEVLKTWLISKPGHRRIDLEYQLDERVGKRTGMLHIDASNVDSEDLVAIASEVFESEG